MPAAKAAAKSDEPGQATVSASDLADGAASTDGAVHQLLANRYIASLNGDDEAAAAATAELGKLGYK